MILGGKTSNDWIKMFLELNVCRVQKFNIKIINIVFLVLMPSVTLQTSIVSVALSEIVLGLGVLLLVDLLIAARTLSVLDFMSNFFSALILSSLVTILASMSTLWASRADFCSDRASPIIVKQVLTTSTERLLHVQGLWMVPLWRHFACSRCQRHSKNSSLLID
jgi:hypothetical protein